MANKTGIKKRKKMNSTEDRKWPFRKFCRTKRPIGFSIENREIRDERRERHSDLVVNRAVVAKILLQKLEKLTSRYRYVALA